MAKLRHMAMSVTDPERSAKFYEETFGMERIGTTDTDLAKGVYLSDGVVCLAMLKFKTDKWAGKSDDAAGKHRSTEFVGVHHVGFWVDDLEKSGQAIKDAGGDFFLGMPEETDTLHYEQKHRDPDGIMIDVSQNGWPGTRE